MNDTERDKLQADRERLANVRGLDRLLQEVETARDVGREFDMPVGASVLADLVKKMRKPVKALQIACHKDVMNRIKLGGPAPGWKAGIQLVDADVLAYLTVRTCFNRRKARQVERYAQLQAAVSVGYYVWLEAKYLAMRKSEKEIKKSGGENRLARLEQYVKARNPRSVNNWLRLLDYNNVLDPENWKPKMRAMMGSALIDAMLKIEGCPFETYNFHNKGKTIKGIRVRDEFTEELDTLYRDYSLSRPIYAPMIRPPVPWTKAGDKFIGGYMTDGVAPFHVGSRMGQVAREGAPAPDNVSDVCMEAVNNVQRTAWRISGAVLEAAKRAADDENVYFDLFGVEPRRAVPARLPDKSWAALSDDERRNHKKEVAKCHDHNFRQESKRAQIARAITLASEDQKQPAIWFPHGIDWRHRVYPISQDLNPQGSDLCRGLLEFASGVPLGTVGYKWLVFHLANTFGMDKISRDEQSDWFNNHLDDIFEVAFDPFGKGYEFWRQSEEPWQFLAACIEICQVNPDNPETWVSHLPVFVDGTCNGLQHLSAMGRDASGAHATNLTSDPERQDIYQIVADKVAMSVARDCTDGPPIDEVMHWSGKINRKVVKRGVMTLPYGLTRIGMRDQLIKDGWTDDGKAAGYLADQMEAAISSSVKSAALIMEWLQFNVAALARAGVSFSWPTPDGSRVTQAYRKDNVRRIHTVLGQAQMYEPNRGGDVLVSRQSLGIVPNLIHSFDAAHLSRTIVGFGDRPAAVVHDSFGTHAAEMDDLLEAIKLQFFLIYDKDWMDAIQSEFSRQAPKGVELRTPPPLGDWDPQGVLASEFFFC